MPQPQRLDEFLKWEPPQLEPILSKGLMYRGSKVILYGRYKSLKSMLALRFCFALSKGEQWLGFQTPKQGLSVLYLQLEVANALLHRRVQKMYEANNRQDDDNRADRETIREIPNQRTSDSKLWIWTEHYIKLDNQFGFEYLEKQIQDIRPDVLVIDPIYRTMTGEMGAMGVVQNYIDQLEKLMGKYNLSLFLVSHTRKADRGVANYEYNSDDMIGSSFWQNWADTLIRVDRSSKEKDVVNVNFEIVRHAEEDINGRSFRFSSDSLDFSPVSHNMMEELLDEGESV